LVDRKQQAKKARSQMSKPLFVSGTARGGTNLAIMIASVHPEVALVQDPYLALLKSFRNAVVTANGAAGFDLQSPLDEYYYFDAKLAVMKRIQEADMDVPFDPAERAPLLATLAARMKLSAPLLIPHLDRIDGRTYRELMENGLRTIGRAWGKPDATWLGFNDNWAIEFFGPLARTFPDARFLAIVRDGRSAVASHVRIMEAQHKNPLYTYKKDPSMVALTLSFVRCWRKQVAFTRHYQQTLKDRLFVLSYERLVQDPERETRRLCAFLGIDYRPAMIDSSNFIAGDGNVWIPNSNQEGAPQGGIYSTTIDRWKQSMSPDMIDLAEFVAGPDLAFAGYELTRRFEEGLPWGAYERHAEQHRQWIGGGFGWRTDNRNPDVDFALELLRRNCLTQRTDDGALVERCFLFPEVYDDLMAGARLHG
jgi:hypothetical protein